MDILPRSTRLIGATLVVGLLAARIIGMPPPWKEVPIPMARPEAPVTAVINAAKRYDVPIDLAVSIAQTESRFRCRVTSKAGARGVMQVMPATARSLGINPDTLYSCTEGAVAGVRVLKALLKTCNGMLNCVAARYNSGRAVHLPPETKNYLVKISELVE